MTVILRVILIIALTISATFANTLALMRNISLKKDVQKEILVKYDSQKKLFKFRWTLYKNGGLVIHRSYDKIVAQNILYQRYNNQSFRVPLKPFGYKDYNMPYILVKFKKFDVEKNEANFDMFLSDEERTVTINYLK